MIHLLVFALVSGLLVSSVTPEDLERAVNPVDPIKPIPLPNFTNIKCWTEWFDRDNPSGFGDFETLAELRSENPGKICTLPGQIEVTTTSGGSLPTGNIIAIMDTITGFVCKNADQLPYKPRCFDYRVRFSCHPPFCASSGVCWTKWFDRDDPSGTGDWETLSNLRQENPGVICAQPLYIESVVVGTNAPAWGQNFLYYTPTQGFVCRNQDQKGKPCLDYKVRFGCPCGC
ncbi:mucin-5AC-like [Osmerus eperlanus]|uniref:mucin-5AC-like n=1 Tax=Osmerus eperlanus TaxID=29151 RepID=UPI002E14D142